MKIIYSILFLSLFACSRKGSNFSAASLNLTNDIVAQMERYQTFDECTMAGKGRATYSPFVYVKKQDDSIYVFSSNTKDSVRLYIKLNNNVWYSHMEYDMWKKANYTPTKDKLSKMARAYDRFFFNDTILEVETSYSLK